MNIQRNIAQEKLITPITKYLAIQLLAVVLLIIMCASNLTAETFIPQKNMTLDLSKTILVGIDGMNLIKGSKEYNSKDPLPNIVNRPDNIEHSKGNSSIIFAYIILGLFACLFVFYVIYIILDFWVLSRREWTQKLGEPEQ